MRTWDWKITIRDRVCVLCGNVIPAPAKVIQTTFRGKITLCGKCRKRNSEVIKMSKYSEMGLELNE